VTCSGDERTGIMNWIPSSDDCLPFLHIVRTVSVSQSASNSIGKVARV